MSAASLPTRTRSVRRPVTGLENKSSLPGSEGREASTSSSSRANGETRNIPRSLNQSPSRLPTRPPSSTSSASFTTTRLARAGSLAQRTSAATSRPGTGDAVTVPHARRVAGTPNSSTETKVASRPPLTLDNKRTLSLRPRKEQTSEATTDRKPSGARHIRNASTSSISSSTPSSISRLPASGHARHASITQLSSSTRLQPPTEKRQSPTSGSSQVKPANAALSRPAFSTLQQHYSPAKSLAPKPTTASLLAPPSPSKLPSNLAITAETARLQAELLQLHLIHRSAHAVHAEWRQSAKSKLRRHFKEVESEHAEVLEEETSHFDRLNALALQDWADGSTPGWGLEDKIVLLHDVLTELWNAGDGGGKYAKLVKRFEEWMASVHQIHHDRESEVHQTDCEVRFIDPIGGSWLDDSHLILRKLEDWHDKLEKLGNVSYKSSLGLILDSCESLIQDMMEEIVLMRELETDIIKDEEGWIRDMIEEESQDESSTAVGAIWRQRLG